MCLASVQIVGFLCVSYLHSAAEASEATKNGEAVNMLDDVDYQLVGKVKKTELHLNRHGGYVTRSFRE